MKVSRTLTFVVLIAAGLVLGPVITVPAAAADKLDRTVPTSGDRDAGAGDR